MMIKLNAINFYWAQISNVVSIVRLGFYSKGAKVDLQFLQSLLVNVYNNVEKCFVE